MFLIGSFEFHTDEAGRIRMPASLKDDLGEDLYIGLGAGEYLVVYPKEYFNTMMQKLAEIPMSDIEKRDRIRSLAANIFPFKYDNQGRYQIPQRLRELVDVSQDVAIVGNVYVVEIWPLKIYKDIAVVKDTPKKNLFGGIDGI